MNMAAIETRQSETSLEAAQAACNKDSTCVGILDSGCNGTSVKLCSEITAEAGTGCVYEKLGRDRLVGKLDSQVLALRPSLWALQLGDIIKGHIPFREKLEQLYACTCVLVISEGSSVGGSLCAWNLFWGTNWISFLLPCHHVTSESLTILRKKEIGGGDACTGNSSEIKRCNTQLCAASWQSDASLWFSVYSSNLMFANLRVLIHGSRRAPYM